MGVVQKMMTASEYSKFLERYMEMRASGMGRAVREVTELDRTVLKDHRSKMTMKQLMEKYGMSSSKIATCIVKASADL